MVPEGWARYALKEVLDVLKDGTHFSPKSKNGPFKYITSKNVKFGYLDLTNVSYISEEEHKVIFGSSPVKFGDVLLTKDGANTGNAALNSLKEEFSLLSSVAILSGDDKYLINSYLLQLILSPMGQSMIKGAMAGQAITRLTLKKIGEFIFPIPPLSEQKDVAQILSTWDNAITTTEKLLKNSQQQKKALMQQLLTGKKRLLDDNGVRFSGEWHKKELGELLDYKQPTPYLVKSTEYSNEYLTPVLTAGKSFILGHTNEVDGVFDTNLPVIIFDDFTTSSQYVDFPFKVKSSAMKILLTKNGVSTRFVYEAMKRINFKVGGHKRHWISTYSNLVIDTPDEDEQKAISKVIFNMSKELRLIEEKLERLKQEKKALMQQLLTGKRRVQVRAEEEV